MKDLHPNSTASYKEHQTSGRAENFRRRIFNLISGSEKPLTDREIMQTLNEPEVNNIRPEITRLKQDELIVEVDKVECPCTRKRVRRTKATGTPYFPRRCRTKPKAE